MSRPQKNTFANVEQILKRRTIISPEGCWLWQGATNKKGYGHVTIEYITHTVSRLSAYLYLGLELKNSRDVQVLHKLECSNKNCWNPEHLYLGSNDDNQRDKRLDGLYKSYDSFRVTNKIRSKLNE